MWPETAEPKRRVALVVSGRMFGGGQRIVSNLHEESVGTRLKLDVVLLGGENVCSWAKDSIPVAYDGSYNSATTLIGTAFRLRRELRRLRVEMLHTHGWDADVIGWLARSGLGIKQLVHLHVTPDWLSDGRFKYRLRRWLTRRVLRGGKSHAVAVSEAVRLHWINGLGVQHDSIKVVRNGIDVAMYHPSNSDEKGSTPVIGVAARLAPMKGIHHLVDALGILAQEQVEFRLKIAGRGSLRGELERRCERVGIQSQVQFLGHVDDMPSFYREIDIYVLPSISTEGMPLSVLEAMGTGLPVVATSVAGTPEAVRNGLDGFLVSPGDVVDLAGALRTLLADATRRRAMGCEGRRRVVEHFSLKRFSDQMHEVYGVILDDGRPYESR